jgi:transcriptional regulator with XRE-family HTH domain
MVAKDALQDPHSLVEDRDGDLEAAIGRQVRRLRKRLDMRVTELAGLAGLSSGMLSKIENGLTSPSLATLQALSTALNVPVTALFQQFEARREATFVAAGQGLEIERRGTRSGHQYRLLGHSRDASLSVEPYMITLNDKSDTFPYFQHAGTEFIYMLDGAMGYRHGDRIYAMTPGDSLFFDAGVPHGPETLDTLPCHFLSIIAYADGSDG